MQSIFLHIHWECSIQWLQQIRAVVLKWLKTPHINFFKTRFFLFLSKKCTWSKTFTNINVNVFFFTYCGSTQCSQPVWGSFISVHPLFLLQESCKQCYFNLFCTFLQGQLVKSKKTTTVYTLQIYIFNSVSTSKHV